MFLTSLTHRERLSEVVHSWLLHRLEKLVSMPTGRSETGLPSPPGNVVVDGARGGDRPSVPQRGRDPETLLLSLASHPESGARMIRTESSGDYHLSGIQSLVDLVRENRLQSRPSALSRLLDLELLTSDVRAEIATA